MAWTVTTSKEKRSDGSLVIRLSYTDGIRNISEFFDAQGSVSPDFLAIRAKQKISFLDTQDASFASIQEGPLTPKDPIVIIPPPPTQDELDRAKFLKDYQTLQKADKAVAAGLLDKAGPDYTAISDLVKSEFKLAYIDFI